MRRISVFSSLLGLLMVAIAGLLSYGQTVRSTVYSAAAVSGAADAAQGPRGLNNLGDVIARSSSSLSVANGAAIWSRDGSQISQPAALQSEGHVSVSAINDSREVVGAANTTDAVVPFMWTANGGMQSIPLLPGDKAGQALSINKSGNVVGYSSGADGIKAFLWTQATGVQNLGTLAGGSHTRARDMNDANQAVGTVRTAKGDRAVLWTKAGSVRDLGTLPGDSSSEATAINNSGDVVGYSDGPAGPRAFLWTKTTGMQSLGALPGGSLSRALDINDAGEVVGVSASSSGDRAFIWTRVGGMKDLNAAVSNTDAILVEAHSINNKGEILVMAMAADGADAAVHQRNLCEPAPEATYLLTPAN